MSSKEFEGCKNIKKVASNKSNFAKVNWDAHLKPKVSEMFNRYETFMNLSDSEPLYFRLMLSCDDGYHRTGVTIPDDIVGLKSIHISFLNGKYKFPSHMANRLELITGAQLVFSQGLSGEIVVFLYLSQLSGIEYEKNYFLIYQSDNPGNINNNLLKEFFEKLWKAQLIPIVGSSYSSKWYKELERIDYKVKSGEHLIVYKIKQFWDQLTPVIPMLSFLKSFLPLPTKN